VIRPVACPKGHLFCRDCLIENLVGQKKEKARELAVWEAAQKKEAIKQKTKDKDETEKIKKSFTESVYNVPLTKERDKYERVQKEEEKEKRKIIDTLTEHKVDAESKKEWIKTSFWAPEMTPSVETNIGKKPDQRLKCPSHIGIDHFLRLKDVIDLKINEGEKGE
jgi:nitric oxide synthase-interacting protein